MSNNVWSIIIRDSRVSTHRFRLKTNSSSGSKTAKTTKTMCLKNNILLNIEKKIIIIMLLETAIRTMMTVWHDVRRARILQYYIWIIIIVFYYLGYCNIIYFLFLCFFFHMVMQEYLYSVEVLLDVRGVTGANSKIPTPFSNNVLD